MSSPKSINSVTPTTEPLIDRLIRESELTTIVGLGKTAINRRISDGTFPKPRRLGAKGARAKAWLYSEVVEWMNNLPYATDTDAA